MRDVNGCDVNLTHSGTHTTQPADLFAGGVKGAGR